jgi:hypothetical protein
MYFINKSTKVILFSLSISLLLLFSACDTTDYSSINTDSETINDDDPKTTTTDKEENNDSKTTNDNSKTINGIAIDGYLENSKVCLDINKNGICNNDEPSGVTSKDGKFSLVTTLNGDYPILVSGGTDTATQESFLGTLKTTISLDNKKSYSNIITNPLTTIATNIYHAEKKSDETFTYKDAKQIVASNLGLDISQIDADPLKNKETFAKTQQIIQTTKLLSDSIEKDSNNTSKAIKAFDHIMKQISSSIKDDTTSADLNISKIIKKLEDTQYNDKNINIASDVQNFIKDFSQEIKTKVSEMNSTKDFNNLQNGFKSTVDNAKKSHKESTRLSAVLTKFKKKEVKELINIPKFINSNTVTIAITQMNAIMLKATNKNNTTLTYSISGADADSFDIDSSLGLVKFKTGSDNRVKILYSFIATVSDEKNTATQNVTIKINTLVVLKTGQTKCYDVDTHEEEECTAKHEGQDGYYQMGKSRSYTVGGGIIKDNATSLQWQDNHYKTSKKDWLDSIFYCADLTAGGYTDWMLPSIQQIRTLANYGKNRPALNTEFRKLGEDLHHSSTTYVTNPSKAWRIDFTLGSLGYADKSKKKSAICVRMGK